ncbi:MAG: NADH-quinone oxidoreductase subunit N [Bacteriovoracaceae bacterium]|nr:NADH-quinone oxidoreductase subunit N [Bacteriovoracaceae bacterium]
MLLNFLTNLSYLVPEVLLLFTICFILFLEATYKPLATRKMLYFISFAGLGLCLLALGFNSDLPTSVVFNQTFVADRFAIVSKILLILATMGILYIGTFSSEIYKEFKAEFFILTLSVLLGAMVVASAKNLLLIYVGIELISILSYALTAIKKKDTLSLEAGFKYGLYGGISSAVMLMGMALFYGVFGSLDLATIAATQTTVPTWMLMVILTLIFSGIAFKLGAFPFHMWSPDVYQGAPTPVTALFSLLPKIAAFVVLARFTFAFQQVGTLYPSWQSLLIMTSIITMTVGNISALGQDSVKRMLAFSAIGHVGLILLTIVYLGPTSIGALLFYLLVYLFMTVVAFSIISEIANKFGSDSQFFFKGLVRRHPFMGVAFAIVLFSMAGIPPFAGFIAKFSILSYVISQKNYAVALVVAFNSIIAIGYYLKLVKVVIVDAPENDEKIEGMHFLRQLSIGLMILPIIILGIFWNGLIHLSSIKDFMKI